jgi:hypothetical protein
MPNWACGTVSITGTRFCVHKFANRFIHVDDADNDSKQGSRYFARSFSSFTRVGVAEEIESLFDGPPETEATFCLPIDFAWSAYSCLIDGYPQECPEQCITLSEACQADWVSVEIQTCEPGMYFEEAILCDKSGIVDAQSRELSTCICPNCGASDAYPSFADLDEYECLECGAIGMTKPGVA